MVIWGIPTKHMTREEIREVRCTTCGAKPREYCREGVREDGGMKYRSSNHIARVTLAAEQRRSEGRT